MKNYRKLLILLFTILLTNLFGSKNTRFFHVSLWKDISTDRGKNIDFHNTSFGLITDTKASLEGFELSLLSNHRPMASGLQIATGANIIDKNLKGMQIALVSNIVLGKSQGAQVSLSNFCKTGFGSQIGLYNQTRIFTGTQIGFLNNNNKIKGIQLGILNNNRADITGAQIGFINFAGNVNGMQFGLLNFAKSNQDIAFGLINFIQDGYYSSDFWMNETGIPFYAFRHGTDNFYTAISIGVKELDDPVFWMSGLSIGSRYLDGIFEFDFNLGSYNVNENILFETHNLNLLNQFKTTLGINVYGDLVLYGGLTVNNFVSDKSDGKTLYQEAKIYNHDGSDIFVRSWFGYVFGIRF